MFTFLIFLLEISDYQPMLAIPTLFTPGELRSFSWLDVQFTGSWMNGRKRPFTPGLLRQSLKEIGGFSLIMPKNILQSLVNTRVIKQPKMMQRLTETTLSAEAKAMVAQMFYSGATQEISTIIDLKGEPAFSHEFWRRLVIAGWGEQLGQWILIMEARDSTDEEVLRLVQLAVRSGSILFALCNVTTGDGQRWYLSIHHALADEQTLKIVGRLVQLAHTGQSESALREMNQGRQAYCRYVDRQYTTANEDDVLSGLSSRPVTPVQLSETGPLAWNAQATRICIHRTVQIESANSDRSPVAVVLAHLFNSNVVSQGDTLTSSQNWRLPHESGAIGMMTGLTALFLGRAKNCPNAILSIEARARDSSVSRAVLECCRASELFINGASPRVIPAEQVISTAFPVGIEIRRMGALQLRLEIEGPFCNKTAATNLLNELADELSHRSQWND